MVTLTPSVTLWVKCDVCGGHEHWINLTEEIARAIAEADGWHLSDENDLRDLCLRCRTESTKAGLVA